MLKRFLTADELLNSAFSLGLEILADGFIPDLIVGVWRGGSPVAIAIHELYCLCGHDIDHSVVRASSYTSIDQQTTVKVQGLKVLQEEFPKASRILLVDDVFDSGRTLEALVEGLRNQRAVTELDIRIATPWSKPSRNVSTLQPDYTLHETDEWLVFPHELCGLCPTELAIDKPGLSKQSRLKILEHLANSPQRQAPPTA